MKIQAALLFSFLFLFASAFAKEVDGGFKTIPALTEPVEDPSGLIPLAQLSELRSLLRKMHETGKIQMAVLVTPTLEEKPIESYSLATAEKWKLGTKKVDQGLLWVIAPHDRKMRFEVGYGLEGDLTDAFTKHVQDDIVRPYFKSDNYAEGIKAGVLAVAEKLHVEGLGTSPPADLVTYDRPSRRINPLLVLFFFLLFPFIIHTLFRGGGGGGGWGGGGGYFGGGGGGWGGGSGGGGGFSGGGGGFGGGGSSSDW